MSKTVFTMDGKEYPSLYVKSVDRSFEVMDGKNTGRLMNFNMVRDVGGTFYNYSMEIAQDAKDPQEYDDFYEKISAPVASHRMTFPYGQSVLTFDAYVTSGKDDLTSMTDGLNVWDGLSINFIAMKPQRRAL